MLWNGRAVISLQKKNSVAELRLIFKNQMIQWVAEINDRILVLLARA